MGVPSTGSEKELPLPTTGKEPYVVQAPLYTVSSAPPPYRPGSATGRTRNPRKCCFVSSVVLNLVLLIALIASGVYLCRYKRKVCDLRIQQEIQKYDELMVPYTVEGCHVRRSNDYGIVDEDDEWENYEDGLRDDDDERKRPHHGNRPHWRPHWHRPDQ